MAKIKLVVSATIEETFSDFIISKKTKGLAEKTLQSYQSQLPIMDKHGKITANQALKCTFLEDERYEKWITSQSQYDPPHCRI
ncbi:MAG: hypothetical protein IJA67_12745 [Oscillospiraceae bacterium]|nr:hypothetical protein [Oscillospiraceae bacterium]